MNVEPTKILIDLASKLYKTNIEIIFFDGSIYDSKDSALFTSKTSFQYSDNPRNPKITLFYNINHFDKFYSLEFYKTHEKIFKKFVKNLNDVINIENNYDCSICKSKENKIIFIKKQLFSACYVCLKNKIDSIIEMRLINFKKDNFISRECKL